MARGYRTADSFKSKDPEKRAKQLANLKGGAKRPKGWLSALVPTLPDPRKFPDPSVMQSPVWSAEHILGVKLWKKQAELLTAIAEHALVACRSANACGKTFVLAVALMLWLLAYEDAIVVTTSSSQRQLKLLWREVHRLLGKGNVKKLLGPNVTLNQMELRVGADRYAVGISANEPENLSGFHSPHTLVIDDEASAAESELMEALLSNGVGENDRLILCGNPLRPSGPFYDAFRDNSWHTLAISAEEAAKDGIPGLATVKWMDQCKRLWGEVSPAYLARVRGEFPEAGTDSLITLVDIDNSCERESTPTGKRVAGCDIARFGDDKSVMIIRQGDSIVHVEAWGKLSLMESCGRILEVARQWSVDTLAVDETGLGSGLVDRLKELKVANVIPVNAGSAASDKERFLNRRAELYWHLKDRIKTLSIPWIHRDKFQELASIKYLFNSNGKIQIESKAEIKSRLGRSPDYADALSLTFTTEVAKARSTPGFFSFLSPNSGLVTPETIYQQSLYEQSLLSRRRY